MNYHKYYHLRRRHVWHFAQLVLLVSGMTQFLLPARSQVAVLTQHNDNSRTGANLQETILNSTNVNTAQFGKLFSVPVDGQIYAQPLYAPHIAIPNQGTHNVVYVATMHNNVYALDADDGAQLWVKNFGTPVPATDVGSGQGGNIFDQIGILSTPVIDPEALVPRSNRGAIYFVSRNKNSDGTYHQWLNALDITTGAPKYGSPVEITATYNSLQFNPLIQNQRAALTLANGNIYIAWASHGDQGPYHGWAMAYSATTLQQVGVYVDTPTGKEGGIWQAGQGMVVDATGNLYFSSGNGSFSADGSNTGNSMVKLSPTLKLLDWFTPYNSTTLNAGDMDLASAGLLGLPGTHYILGGGKQGVLYLVDNTNMGHYNSSADQVVQSFQAIFGTGSSHIHGTPIYYNNPLSGPTIYVWGENDYLRAYAFNTTTQLFTTTAVKDSAMTAPVFHNWAAMPGGFLSLSANGNQAGTGIIWAATPYDQSALRLTVRGILHAFDATTLAELWNDKLTNGPDDLGYFAKYTPPTIANGKVYLASFGPVNSAVGTGALVVYGLIPANTTKLILDSVADAYVESGTSADTNFSSSTNLQVQAQPVSQTCIAFVKFEISDVPNAVTLATLRLFGSGGGTAAVYAVADTTWTDLGITYNNMPVLGTQLATTSIKSTSRYYSWDATSYLKAQQQAGAHFVTFAVAVTPSTSTSIDNFQSRRLEEYPPQLAITTDIGGPSFGLGFGSGEGLSFNGSATLQGGQVELTNGGVLESGSVFYTPLVNIASFHTTFQFQLLTPDAEGFTFTIQGVGPNALGGTGSGLGYGPDLADGDLAAIGKSAAIKFDLYNDAGEGSNSTGLFTNGAVPTVPAIDLTGSGINLHSGHVFQAVLQYDGTTLTETLTDTTNGASVTETYPVNLPALAGGSLAYVGFTASTGLETAVQRILTWTFGN